MNSAKTTMDVKEVAGYLGVSDWWVYTMAKRGLLPHIRISGRLLFRKVAIDRFLSEKEAESMKMAAKL